MIQLRLGQSGPTWSARRSAIGGRVEVGIGGYGWVGVGSGGLGWVVVGRARRALIHSRASPAVQAASEVCNTVQYQVTAEVRTTNIIHVLKIIVN